MLYSIVQTPKRGEGASCHFLFIDELVTFIRISSIWTISIHCYIFHTFMKFSRSFNTIVMIIYDKDGATVQTRRSTVQLMRL